MKKILPLLLSLQILIAGNLLTKNDLETTGSFRLGDIFRNSSNFYTADGYFYHYSFKALTDYQHENYALLIDGHEPAFNFTGVKNINSLPVNFNALDSIVIIDTPTCINGKIANSGVIKIFTRQTEKKLYINNTIKLGNESKDSGPFRYTRFSSPNVDKTGSDINGSLGYNLQGHQISANYHYRQHIFTDWSTRTRIENLSAGDRWPMMVEYGGAISSRGKFLATRYSLLLSSVKSDHSYLYFEPLGKEIPFDYTNQFLSLKLDKKLFPQLDFSCSFSSEKELMEILTTDQTQTYGSRYGHQTVFQFIPTEQKMVNAFGLRLFHEKFTNHKSAFSETRLLPTLFMDIRLPFQKIGKITLSESITFYNDCRFTDLLLSYQKSLMKNARLYAVFSRTETIDSYNINNPQIAQNFISSKLQGPPLSTNNKNLKYTLDTKVQISLSRRHRFSVGFFSRYFEDFLYREIQYDFNPLDYALIPKNTTYKPATGVVNGLRADLQWRQSPALRFELGLTLQTRNSEDDIFLNAWKSIPKTTFHYGMDYNPTESFSLWVGMTHTSKTLWQDYEKITGIEYFSSYKEIYTYNHHLNPLNRLDVKLRKTLFYDKITINFLIRNLTNRKIYYYPVGASFDMAMFLGLEFNL